MRKTIKKPAQLKSWPWWRVMMTVLNIIALILSLILSWHFIKGGTMAGCGSGTPCDQVLNSRWSSVAGIIPVSGLATGVYLALLAAGFFITEENEYSIRRLAWNVMLILAGSIAGSAVWFTIVQKFIIGAFCPYCMTAHIAGFLLALLIIWRARAAESKHSGYSHPDKNTDTVNGIRSVSCRLISPAGLVLMVLSGLVLSAVIPVSQSGYKAPSAFYSSKSVEKMPVLDYYNSPLIGSPDAPEKVFLMFDYQCSHCQQLHFMLDIVIGRYADKLAFVLCPAPLNPRCNPYVPAETEAFRNSCELARTGLAVWRADRRLFQSFQNYMFTFESGDRWRPRSPEEAMAKAIELTGNSRFIQSLSDPWIDNYLEKCVSIYGQTMADGKGGIPRLLYGSRWIIPDAMNAGELAQIIKKSLGVPLP